LPRGGLRRRASVPQGIERQGGEELAPSAGRGKCCSPRARKRCESLLTAARPIPWAADREGRNKRRAPYSILSGNTGGRRRPRDQLLPPFLFSPGEVPERQNGEGWNRLGAIAGVFRVWGKSGEPAFLTRSQIALHAEHGRPHRLRAGQRGKFRRRNVAAFCPTDPRPSTREATPYRRSHAPDGKVETEKQNHGC
jgi:hypothetical protein